MLSCPRFPLSSKSRNKLFSHRSGFLQKVRINTRGRTFVFSIWSHRSFEVVVPRCSFSYLHYLCVSAVVFFGAALLVGSSVRSFGRPFVRLCVPVCLTRCCVRPSVVAAVAAAKRCCPPPLAPGPTDCGLYQLVPKWFYQIKRMITGTRDVFTWRLLQANVGIVLEITNFHYQHDVSYCEHKNACDQMLGLFQRSQTFII